MINNGGSAFPRPFSEAELLNGGRAVFYEQNGMTLRDWFAGRAMQALLSKQGAVGSQVADECEQSATKCAEWSYQQADAMIAQRVKE